MQSVKGYLRNSEGNLVKGNFEGRIGKEINYKIIAYCDPVPDPKKANRLEKCNGKVLLSQKIVLPPQRAKKFHKNKRKFDIITKGIKHKNQNIIINQCYPIGKYSTTSEKNTPRYVKSKNSLLTYSHTRCNVKFGEKFYAPASLEIKFRTTPK